MSFLLTVLAFYTLSLSIILLYYFQTKLTSYKAVDHPYLVIHSDTQRDKGQDALVLAETNAAAREKEKDKIADIKIAGRDDEEEVEVLVSISLSARETQVTSLKLPV